MTSCNEYSGLSISNYQNYGFISIGTQILQSVAHILYSSNDYTYFFTPPHNDLNYVKNSKFGEVFLEYVDIMNSAISENYLSENIKENLFTKLDEILIEFPIESYPELASVHFEWDDTTRIVLDYAPIEQKLNLIKQLCGIFFKIYDRISNVSNSSIENDILDTEKKIEIKRDEIISKYYTPSEKSKRLAEIFMEDITYH